MLVLQIYETELSVAKWKCFGFGKESCTSHNRSISSNKRFGTFPEGLVPGGRGCGCGYGCGCGCGRGECSEEGGRSAGDVPFFWTSPAFSAFFAGDVRFFGTSPAPWDVSRTLERRPHPGASPAAENPLVPGSTRLEHHSPRASPAPRASLAPWKAAVKSTFLYLLSRILIFALHVCYRQKTVIQQYD